jgi:Muramidase (flagellum-specific)
MESTGLVKFYDPAYLYGLSEKYGIDPGFVLATFILETGWGKESEAWLSGYNPAGIVCQGSYCFYDTPEQGMEEMYKLLKTYADGSVEYIGKRNTVEQVRDKWSEAKDTDKVLEIWRAIYDKR